MKYFSLIILLAISLTSLDMTAQKKEGQKKVKPSKVYINEINLFGKDGNSNYSNGRGAYEWIEIFNGTSLTINIQDFFLTDDLNEPSKWVINPIHRNNIWLKKKRFFPVYIHNRARRNGALISDFETDKEFLYLIKKENGVLTVMDTIKLPSNQQCPYSRYPDGGEFITTNWLTPGSENLLLRDSESKNTYGLSVQIGESTSSSAEFQNSTRPALAGGSGIYSRKNFGLFALEYGLRLGIRGYRIDYSSTYNTTTGTREVSSKGRQTLFYVDIPYFLSTNLLKNLSVFGGSMLSIRVKSALSYTTETNFTPFNNTKPQIHTISKYHSQEGNAALDLIDFSMVIGLRYRLHKTLNLSVYYMSDLTGLNIGAGNGFSTQRNNGVYFSVDRPLLFGRKRVKRKGIFH
jgi:hypothetical protein